MPNETAKSFDDESQDACLFMERFRSRVEGNVRIGGRRRACTEVRPHSSLGKMKPMAIARIFGKTLIPEVILNN